IHPGPIDTPMTEEGRADPERFAKMMSRIPMGRYGRPEEVANGVLYLASDESMVHLAGVMNCIMCGCCVSDCTVLEVDENFIGPAALAKAYRFVADPRDGKAEERLKDLNEPTGIWDCTRCMQCVEVCPKGVDPMGRIMALRDRAMEAGYDKTTGARHANAFADSVGHSGWLDELRLPIKSHGITNVREMLKLIPLGIRSQRVGKVPPIFHKSIPGVENVRRIFRKAEDRP
ncbi:MAG: SDR family oxidoreductase, partial [Planctomycetes bacterium]|nr:SDR family oxidoreductase [Planctomycetota bacterium]